MAQKSPLPYRSLKGTDQDARHIGEVIAIGDPVKKVDFHVPLMSLAHLTASQWDTIPSEPHYLEVRRLPK